MGKIKLLLVLIIGLLILWGCEKESPNAPTVVEDYDSDYEEISSEDDIDIGFIPPILTEEQEPDTTSSGKFIARAQSILDNLNETKYVHSDHIVLDEENGIYKYDCSGFVCEFILKECLKNHYDDLVAKIDTFHSADTRPRAWTFYDYFRSILGSDYDADSSNTHVNQNQYWKVFTSIDSLKKGDIIVARYHDDWRAKYKKEEKESPSTGHVMISWSIAYQSTGNNAAENDYDIKILDSSLSGHYWDTRNEPHSPSIDGSGIGVGWMRYGISTHLSKRPYKYKWKLSSSSYYNLYNNSYNSHDKLKGIIFARPI